jgi:type II secretory pathway component PulF
MALMFMPGGFSRRAEFYYQLAQLTSAGLGLVAALEQLKANPPARSFRRPVSLMLQQLAQGYTLTDSLQNTGSWVPEFDTALLQAGEQSGRLDLVFGLLASYYEDRARMARQIISDLMYPVFLFHFAIFILPFAQLFTTGNWAPYLRKTVGVLVPIYAVVVAVIYLAQSRHGETWRAWVERLIRPIPVLGTARYYLALSRLAAALESLLAAGVTIIEAWELAAGASGSPALRRTVLGWRPLVRGGQTPAEVVTASGRFPSLFSSQYNSGEISGSLEQTLQRLHRYYREEGSRKLHALAQWTPKFVFLLVALMIAYNVIQFYSGHFKQIRDAGGF